MANYQSKSFNLVLMQIISPALIMVMVASLVFFLIEVFYRGPHGVRLYWVMGLFTFASVLVSRVSVEEGKERAYLLGFALAAATFVSSSTLIEFRYAGLSFLSPIVILGLIATVMWSSAKLTWDCTVVDRSRDASATGLVDLLRSSVRDEISTAQQTDRTSLLKRWITGKPKKNNPGLWVFYFAIFAFPVFGFGQWFVESGGRWWTFVLFAIYLGATLSLLMTTSLLGLERYLSKRKLHVPTPIARNWVITGGTFAALVMLIVIFVPKPPSAGWSNDLAALFQSQQRDGKKFAPGKDGNKNDPDAQKQNADPNAKDVPQGDKGNDKNSQPGSEQGKEGKQDKSHSDKSGQKNANKNQQKSKQENSQPKGGNEENQANQNQQNRNQPDQNGGKRNKRNDNQQEAQQNQQQSSSKSQPSQAINKFFESLSGIFRAVVYLIGVVAAVILIVMFKDQILALFKRKDKSQPAETASQSQPVVNLPGFRSFRNPFQGGGASMPPIEIVEYTKSALEAWAREFDIQQGIDDTPEELAARIKPIDAKVAKYAKLHAAVYGRIAFSDKADVGRDDLAPLVKLWQHMNATFSKSRNVATVATP